MGHWQDRIVYFRDFAYNARRLRMAHGNIGDVPAVTYAELLSGPMIDIYVGESKRHWALHRNLLCHHSESLEAELQGDGKKKQDKLELPDFDPAGFELLVKWLYQGKLDDVSDMADANQKYDYAVSCHKLYLLCDRFDMPQLKNVAMDQYRKGLNEAQLVPDADEINDIYRKSPTDSPFRRLMTKIAARQIMDPESDRDVQTYRECFENNPAFAIDLVTAIKNGTGGMLFEDPTDPGNECDYHDHEAGPNCHIKGKGKIKQGVKAPVKVGPPPRPGDPKSYRSAPSNHDRQALPLRQPPKNPPDTRPPQPLPRQARRQDGTSAGSGPLRRRLTSPASSTVETSTENATATPPSPNEQRDKFRRVTPPQAHLPGPVLEEESPQAPEDHHQSSEGESHQHLDSSSSDASDKGGSAKQAMDDAATRRGIWEWARVGTGKLGIIGRIPHPGIMTSKAATSAVNGVLGGSKTTESSGSLDDFSIPSAVSTEPENQERQEEAAAAKIEGLGISNSSMDAPVVPSSFAQTKRSSDDLVAASINGTPSPNALKTGSLTNGDDSHELSPPVTPSPASRKKSTKDESDVTPSPHRIPKYKIALTSSLLSPARTPTS